MGHALKGVASCTHLPSFPRKRESSPQPLDSGLRRNDGTRRSPFASDEAEGDLSFLFLAWPAGALIIILLRE